MVGLILAKLLPCLERPRASGPTSHLDETHIPGLLARGSPVHTKLCSLRSPVCLYCRDYMHVRGYFITSTLHIYNPWDARSALRWVFLSMAQWGTVSQISRPWPFRSRIAPARDTSPRSCFGNLGFEISVRGSRRLDEQARGYLCRVRLSSLI